MKLTSAKNDKQRELYHKGRAKLIKDMGGRCKDCGTRKSLEFHHRFVRTWDPAKKSRWQRLAIYRREWSANAIELLCKSCNASRGPAMAKQTIGDHELVPVRNVKLHPGRFYRDKIDLDDLMRSMAGPNGQLQPIGVDTSGYLIWGRRRLEVARKLGWPQVMARIIDLHDPMQAIQDENACRMDFTVSEKVAMAKLIEDSEKSKARRRQSAAGPKNGKGAKASASEKFTEAVGEAKDKAAEAVGMSRPTYEKAKEVVEAAAADPSKNGLVEEMDASGKVSGAHRKLKESDGAETVKDDEGAAVPVHCEAAFALAKRIMEICRTIDRVCLDVDAVAGKCGGEMIHKASLIQAMKNARQTLYASRATHVCPYCSGEADKCTCCKGRGWTTKAIWQQAPKK